MACSSINRMGLVKKIEKALVTKKQQSMSNYRFISSSALELQCRCALSDCKMIAVCVSSCYLFTLRCCPRCTL